MVYLPFINDGYCKVLPINDMLSRFTNRRPNPKGPDTPNQCQRTSGDEGIASHRLCLGQKVALEHTSKTIANSPLARMFCEQPE